MTVKNPAIFLQASAHPAEDVRRFIGAVQSQGLARVGDLNVTEKSGTPNMSVDVAGGRAFIDGTEAPYQGCYLVENRGNTNVPLDNSDPTNPRIDLIVAEVQDAGYSGATNAWSLVVVKGTAAPAPTRPTPPANSIVLADVLVSAAVTSILNVKITPKYTTLSRPWNSAWGIIPGGLITRTSAYAGWSATLSTISSFSVTVDLLAGRRYKVSYAIICYPSVAATVGSELWDSVVGTRIQSAYGYAAASGAYLSFSPFTIISPGASTRGFSVKVLTTGGTGTVSAGTDQPMVLSVEDIGPA